MPPTFEIRTSTGDVINRIIAPDLLSAQQAAFFGDSSHIAVEVANDDAARLLKRERAEMKVYRRAFNLMLMQLPDPAGNLAHMLEALDAMIGAAGTYSDLAMAVRDVTLFERTHPDMDAFGTTLGISATDLDQMFRIAMAIEAGASPAEIAALLT